MRRTMGFMMLFLGVSLFISGNVFAAWTQAKGHSYNQLTLSYYKTTSKFTTIEKDAEDKVLSVSADPFKNAEEEFTSTKISYYGEFGLKDDLTAIFSTGWDWVESNDIDRFGNDNYASGVGDIIVGLRQKISDNIGAGMLMSVQAEVKIPEAYDYFEPIEFQSLGDGQYDAILKLVFGKGFSKGYAVFSAGYKYRFENDEHDPLTFKPSDQFLVSLSGGYNATSWLSIRGTVGWNRAVGNAEVSNDYVDYAARGSVNEINWGEEVLILDTLGLEQSALSAGVSLAFTITPKTQTVLSYNTDLQGGDGIFATENASIGETFSIAFVYMH